MKADIDPQSLELQLDLPNTRPRLEQLRVLACEQHLILRILHRY